MAGDWIKWTKGLAKRREVIVMASRLKRDRHEIAGRLMELWEWCDENIHTEDVPELSFDVSLILGDKPFEFVDALLGLPGMAEAMSSPEVRWLERRSGGRIVFPNLARHNGTSAKTRAYEASKKQRQRQAKADAPEDKGQPSPKSSGKYESRDEKLVHPLGDEQTRNPRVPMPESPIEAIPSIHGIESGNGQLLMYFPGDDQWTAAFVRWWNALPGVHQWPLLDLDDQMKANLHQRMCDPKWFWKRAVQHFPLTYPDNRKPSLSWFLELGSLGKILSGRYQETKPKSQQAAKPKRDIFAGLRASEEKARNEESVPDTF